MDRQVLHERRLRAWNVLHKIGRTEFKPETSAKWVDVKRSWDGSILVQIEHDTVKDCTPEMLRWWFENLAATTTWNGEDFSGPEVSFYHLWHHRDHISITPVTRAADGSENRGFAVGAVSIIREQFNDHHDKVNAHVLTTRLDESEFTFLIKQGRFTAGRIVHRYHQTEDGLRFYAETKVGLEVPLLGVLFNWLVLPRVYSVKTAEHWIKHNIEETGQTEAVLPALYAARNRA